MKLVIGNKNYSSWSLRPWLLLSTFGIEFEEVQESLRQERLTGAHPDDVGGLRKRKKG